MLNVTSVLSEDEKEEIIENKFDWQMVKILNFGRVIIKPNT